MKVVYICEIVDSLSKAVTHTFMAASHEHGVRQFKSFLKSLEGKIHNEDFYLIIPDAVYNVPDSFDEAWEFVSSCVDGVYRGSEVMKDES